MNMRELLAEINIAIDMDQQGGMQIRTLLFDVSGIQGICIPDAP